MRNTSGKTLAAALLFLGIDTLGAAQPGVEEVIVADYLDYANAPAFYVDAPRSLRDAMISAVGVSLDHRDVDCALEGALEEDECSWVRQPATLRYFRALTGAGKAVRSGMVCPDADWLPHQRYYRSDFLERDCLRLDWSTEEHRYSVAPRVGLLKTLTARKVAAHKW